METSECLLVVSLQVLKFLCRAFCRLKRVGCPAGDDFEDCSFLETSRGRSEVGQLPWGALSRLSRPPAQPQRFPNHLPVLGTRRSPFGTIRPALKVTVLGVSLVKLVAFAT